MTDYTDIQKVNALYQERQIVDNAIVLIDAGGYLASIMIMPAEGDTSLTIMSPVALPPPTPPDTIATVRTWLVQREADIDAELEALGVTNAPPARA